MQLDIGDNAGYLACRISRNCPTDVSFPAGYPAGCPAGNPAGYPVGYPARYLGISS